VGLIAQGGSESVRAQSDQVQISGLDVEPRTDGPGFHITITATNTGVDPATRNFVLLDQPSQGAAYPIGSGYVTLAPGGSFEVPFDWTPPTSGTHRIYIDGDDQTAVEIEVVGPPPTAANPAGVSVTTTACVHVNLPGSSVDSNLGKS